MQFNTRKGVLNNINQLIYTCSGGRESSGNGFRVRVWIGGVGVGVGFVGELFAQLVEFALLLLARLLEQSVLLLLLRAERLLVLALVVGELALGLLALLEQPRLLGVLGLDVAHVARGLFGRQILGECVDLLHCALLYVGVEVAVADGAVGVVAQHLAVEEAVDEEAGRVGVAVVGAYLGLIVRAEFGDARRVGVDPFVEDEHRVVQEVGEYLAKERNGALGVGGEARILAVEADEEHVDVAELLDVLDHVADVLHVLGVAARVREALGVDEAQVEAVRLGQEARRVRVGHRRLGHGAVAHHEHVLAREHVQQRALAHARAA